MRGIGLAAIFVVAVSASAADAELFDGPDWFDRSEAVAQSLLQSLNAGRTGDHDIVKPAGNIDPEMAVVPRQLPGPMPIIPPERTGRQ